MKNRKRLLGTLTLAFALLTGAGSFTAVAASGGASNPAGKYKIQAQVYVDGALVSTPQLITLRGEEAIIEIKTHEPSSELKLKVLAEDLAGTAAAIDLKMDVEYKQAERRLSSRPRLAVLPGEEGTVSVAEDGVGALEMKIKAERM